ncbi:MAG: hypothetical protein K2P88_11700 [Chitinophagaceae bacterium]|uniref:hypothetical protein n=1 Tax=unclassified Paraflavitalea TaxID=2798305 RepID=UPI003D32CDB9|nr:hypothetical protein [Chitinophagaceae bacterium]
MKTLSETWFADGYIDFELKKYTLLAYLKEISEHFNENKLYPQLADLIFHYNNLVSFRENKRFLQDQFPKRFTGIQLQKLELLYEQLVTDDELMQELEEIIQYASNRMKYTITSGTEIYEFVEDKLNIYPIGLVPIESNEGYFFLSSGEQLTTRIYRYRLNIIEKQQERYRTMKTEYMGDYRRSFVNTYEGVKLNLIKEHKDLPNPAVYTIETELQFPIDETLLPIAKRSLVRYIMS